MRMARLSSMSSCSRHCIGTLQAALLFWRKLSAALIACGFEINSYDWCIANKMIDGKQCTVLWHVDDLKLLHVKIEITLINTNLARRLPSPYNVVGYMSTWE